MPPTLLRTLFSGSGGWTYATAVAAPSPRTRLRVSPRIHQPRDVPATWLGLLTFQGVSPRRAYREHRTSAPVLRGRRYLDDWSGSWRGSIRSMWRGHAPSGAPRCGSVMAKHLVDAHGGRS